MQKVILNPFGSSSYSSLHLFLIWDQFVLGLILCLVFSLA